jgi:hypothetical protein
MFFAKNFEFSFTFLFDTFDAPFDDCRGSSNFCNIEYLSNDRNEVFQQLKWRKKGRDGNSTESFSSNIERCLLCCRFRRGLSGIFCVLFKFFL